MSQLITYIFRLKGSGGPFPCYKIETNALRSWKEKNNLFETIVKKKREKEEEEKLKVGGKREKL